VNEDAAQIEDDCFVHVYMISMILTGCCALGHFAAITGMGHYYRFKRGDCGAGPKGRCYCS